MSKSEFGPPVKGELESFLHLGVKYYHQNKERKDYYFMQYIEEKSNITYICTDHKPGNKKSCGAKLIELKKDGNIKLDGSHICGNTHFFIPGRPVFVPLMRFRLPTRPKWIVNKIFTCEPNHINIKHTWYKSSFGKIFFSFVNRDAMKSCAFDPECSKVTLRLTLKEEDSIIDNIVMSNCGRIPKIICVKEIDANTRKKNKEIGNANYVLIFKLPSLKYMGEYDVTVEISNSPFICYKEKVINVTKSFTKEETNVGIKGEPRDDLSKDFEFMMFTNHHSYGSYYFDKMIVELCGDGVSFFTNQIVATALSRRYKKRFDCFGMNLLIHFAARGWLDLIELLVEEGFDVNHQDHFGNTALFWAKRKGREKVVNYLLSRAADENIKNKCNETYKEFSAHFNEDSYKILQKEVKESMDREMTKKNTQMQEQIKEMEKQVKPLTKEHGKKHLKQDFDDPIEELKKKNSLLKKEIVGLLFNKELVIKDRPRVSQKKGGRVNASKRPPLAPNSKKNEQRSPKPSKPVKRKTFRETFKGFRRGLSKIGRKMKKTSIDQWQFVNITDWLDDIGLRKVCEKHFKKHKVISFAEIKKIKDDSKKIESWGLSNKHKKLLNLNINYLITSKKKYQTFRTKDPYYAVLSKLSLLKDWTDVSQDEIEKLINFLSKPGELKTFFSSKNEPVKLQIILSNDQFHSQSLKEYIGYAFDNMSVEKFLFYSSRYVSGILINDVYLEWNGSSLIVPRRMKNINFVHYDVKEYETLKEFNSVKNMICETIVRWNTTKIYGSSNCQVFVDDFLKCVCNLKLNPVNYDPNTINYLEQLKRTGRQFKTPLELKQIDTWSIKDCQLWLKMIDFEILQEEFKKNKMSGRKLIKLKDDHEMLVKNILDEKKKRTLCIFLANVQNCSKKSVFFNRNIVKVVHKMYDFFDDNFFSVINSNIFPMVDRKSFQNKYLSTKMKNLSEIKVEVIITDMVFDEKQRLNGKFNQKFVDQIYFPRKEHGIYHAAVLVGPWYLDWTGTEIVIPKELTTQAFKTSTNINTMTLKVRDIKEIKSKLALVCIKWNSYFHFHVKRDNHHGNSMHFVDDILQKLGIDWKLEKGTLLHKFIEGIRENSSQKILFEPTPAFIKYFKMGKNKKLDKFKEGKVYSITFKTHSELDEFVYFLFKTANKKLKELTKKFPFEFRLLMSFDKSFWLRNNKFRKDERFKPTSSLKIGCPFRMY